jgi:hypothetical protein
MGNSFIYVLFWVLYYTLPSGGFIANPAGEDGGNARAHQNTHLNGGS